MKKQKTGEPITSSEQKALLLDMLKYVDGICRKNHINYSLVGGSLIGAIRHQGFIPWDDDIDIILMHDDYLKLQWVLSNEKGRYLLLTPTGFKKYRYPFPKLIDTKTMIKEKGRRDIENYGVFLDIFEYHYVPNNKTLARIHYVNQICIKKFFALASLDPRKSKGFLGTAASFFSCLVPIALLKRTYICHCTRRKPTNYVVSNWPAYGLRKEKQLAKNTKEYIDMPFEDMKAMVFKDYDGILKTTFGDYMKLPPVSQRKTTHEMDILWR